MKPVSVTRSAAIVSGLAALAGLSLLLAVRTAEVPGFGLVVVGSFAGLIAIVAPARRTRPSPAPRDGGRLARTSPPRSGVAAVGATMTLGLLLAVASRGAGVAGLEITLAGLAGCAVLVAPGVGAASRRLLWPVLGTLLVIVALVRLGSEIRLGDDSLDLGYVWQLALLFGAGAGGLLLLADALGASQRRDDAERTGWTLLTRTRRERSAARQRSTVVWRSVVGGLMVLWATGLGIALAASHVGGHPVLVVLSALAVMIAALVVIGTPLVVTAFVSRQRRAADRTREAERQRIAAHLHDSVLQTLALVQRQAADPDAVARLAQRQELSLRNWMAGESELEPGSLAAALQAIVIEVGDATEVSIELSMVGDRPTEPRDEALVSATREALRNAARHARGSPVAVYAEVMDRQVEVYVRDDGPGFRPGEIPDTRRGIRDAILARMQAAGGSAEIIAEPGHGTEVMLRLPAA